MDWPLVNPEFDPDDLKQVLRYVPRKSYGISWYDGEEVWLIRAKLQAGIAADQK